MDCREFLAFCELDDARATRILERICEAHYNDGKDETVSFDLRHRHDAVNYTLSGTVKDGDDEFRFIIEDGNRVGTVVDAWGTDETVGIYQPPKPTIWDMEPIAALETNRPEMWKVYLLWREENWFHEMCRGYAYDKHFSPGGSTERYWRDKAAKKGLQYGTRENVLARIASAA